MSNLQVGVVGFDITPGFHPQFGAWGTTPTMTELDMPLLARCIAMRQGGQQLLWFGSDLVGDSVPQTDKLRKEVADALNLEVPQVIWSTSQTHSSGAVPGSLLTGSSICEIGATDETFVEQQWRRFIEAYIESGREAINRLQPAQVWVGRGYCDSMSYNTRFPMPTGGVKFSRHHGEGLQSGKFFDPTIGLLRFDDLQGKVMGAIFNFCSHPATMVNNKCVSPDWVGTARQLIEEEIGGAPAMFVQGMCGDVNCHHIFGTPAQAKRNGTKLGEAAVRALPHLMPVRSEPFTYDWRTIELPCRPMYTRQEIDEALAARREFLEELKDDPSATWFCGINAPDPMSVQEKTAFVQVQIDYLLEGLRILEAGETVRSSLPFTLGAIRIGDLAIALSPGENFTATGRNIRTRSPFCFTLVCGDTNGLFGYIGDDDEIDRGGYETDSYWKMLYIDGFRLALAKGTVPKILSTANEMLSDLQ